MLAPHSRMNWQLEPDVEELRRLQSLRSTNPEKAYNGMEQLAGQGSIASMLDLAYAYANGLGVQVDLYIAEAWYRRAMEAGSPYGSYGVGAMNSRKKDFGKALQAFRAGAASDFVPSLYRMGRIYKRGLGVEANPAQAREFWQRASDLGHVRAKRDLAFMLMSGKFGIARIPSGAALLWSAIGTARQLSLRNVKSDLLWG